MDKPRGTRPYDAQDDDELFDESFTVMSSTECTGLIPSAPTDEAQIDSYAEIYDIPLSKDKTNEKLQDMKRHWEIPGHQE